ncbi:MAG: pyridine nucleotide-disulfide oxidoreductase, partial [Vicinamibacterales bacterium]
PPAYRRPSDLPDAGVLVVGASASGLQLADELQASGRPVTLAVGQHTRLPRRYLGHDICYWLDAMGLLTEPVENVADAAASRSQPSLQLVGRPDHATLDLAALRARGVTVVGRVLGVDGHRWHLADDLVKTTAAADAKLALLLDRIDRFAARHTPGPIRDGRDRFEPLWPAFTEAPRTVDTRAAGIGSIVWATGYRRRYPWLKVPVLDSRGEIDHRGGETPEPGLFVIGLHFLRRRNSSFLDGVGADAEALATRVAAYVRGRQAA